MKVKQDITAAVSWGNVRMRIAIVLSSNQQSLMHDLPGREGGGGLKAHGCQPKV